jgi:hypothetical protein
MLTNWKARALAAEAALISASRQLDGIEAIQADRAALVSITRDGAVLKFTFVRNGELTVCETYGTLDQDVPGWRRALLERLP